MVKGLSKKIIVVKSPDPKIFEQAIFIVRDDYLMNHGINQKELMRQANEAASGYVNTVYSKKGRPLVRALICGIAVLAVIGMFAAAVILI